MLLLEELVQVQHALTRCVGRIPSWLQITGRPIHILQIQMLPVREPAQAQDLIGRSGPPLLAVQAFIRS